MESYYDCECGEPATRPGALCDVCYEGYRREDERERRRMLEEDED